MKNRTLRVGTSLVVFLCLVAFTVPPSAIAGPHTWSGAVNGNWNNAGNWSAGGVPAIGEANLTISFPGSATRTVMTNNIGALTFQAMTFSGSNYVLRGASALSFNNTALLQLLCSGDSNVIESTLNLSNFFALSVSDNDVMAFHTLTGPGTVVKFGEGELHLRGAAANTLSGGYTVNIGSLQLQKTGGATAIAAPLTIVGTTNIGEQASVRLNGSEQIAGNVNVVIHPSGILAVNGFTNTLNDLTVMSGTVWLGGLVRLNGDLTLSGTDNPFPTPDVSPLMDVDLEFIGSASTLMVSNVICKIDGNIVEYGTATVLNKTGPGTLSLEGTANNYTGALNIQQGRVVAAHSTALGTLAGATTVSNGATLQLSPGISSAEALLLTGLGDDGQGALQLPSGTLATLSGNISITGETGISVGNANGVLNLDGPISGAGGIRKFGAGTVSLNGFGNNSFAGASFVANGRLTLNKGANVRAIGSVGVTNGAAIVFNANEQMDNAGVLSIYSGGSVNLTNRSETLGGMNLGRGVTVDSGTGTLTLLGNVFVGLPYSAGGSGGVTLRGTLSLGGGTRHFSSVETSFYLECPIIDGAGVGGLSLAGDITQNLPNTGFGYGFFHLMGTNTYTGPTYLDFTSLRFYTPQSFGAPGGGVICTNNPEMIFWRTNLVITGETLTSNERMDLYPIGSNAWNGPWW